MTKDTKVLWFEEVGKEDIPLVGGKGANLGEMTKAHIQVPPGFIVTAQSYFHFLEEASLIDEIRRLLSPLDTNDSQELSMVASKIKDMINAAPMPKDITDEIKKAYQKMGGGLVAVRSSATAEDLPEASFAGQQRTFLNVEGENEVTAAVQGCWASLFESRAIFYRAQHGFDHLQVGIAVPVQRMVQSECSGVLFTLEPVTSDKGKVVIEAVYGLGETLVSGEITPDLYVVKKDKSRVPYDRDKVIPGLQKACYKREVSAEQIQQIADKVEEDMFRNFDKEVPSTFIGESVMKHLRRTDKVAYIRFASVYRDFKDAGELIDEVSQVIQEVEYIEQPKLFDG